MAPSKVGQMSRKVVTTVVETLKINDGNGIIRTATLKTQTTDYPEVAMKTPKPAKQAKSTPLMKKTRRHRAFLATRGYNSTPSGVEIMEITEEPMDPKPTDPRLQVAIYCGRSNER